MSEDKRRVEEGEGKVVGFVKEKVAPGEEKEEALVIHVTVIADNNSYWKCFRLLPG